MEKYRKIILFSLSFLFLFSCASAPLNATSETPAKAVAADNGKIIVKADSVQIESQNLVNKSADSSAEKRTVHAAIDEKQAIEPIKKDSPLKNKDATIEISSSRQSNPDEIQEQQETLDQALDLLNQSQNFWQQGDIDNSLRCLDEAYALILEVNGDPEIARQKDDLRLIISKRIIELSTTKHTVTKGNQSEIPLIMNADVEREIRSFQTVERGFFLRSYQRSGQYRPIILKYLQEAGLPKELSWLPLVESGFQCNALSRARALGLWQFIPSTGYKFSLKRDRWVDERLNVEKSTLAAIAYMKELHSIFGDWLTCLAAYNCGEGRVLRVISKQHLNYLDHFWDLYRQLPNETARYVPRFLATLHIIKDPKKHGMDLSEDLDKPIPYESVKVDRCMRLQDIAQHLNVSREIMSTLNSELKLQLTPDRPYDLKVPGGSAKLVSANIDDIPKWEPPRPVYASKSSSILVRHKVNKGESLKGIARRYKTTVKDIMEYNDLSTRKVTVGQVLRVPARGYAKKAKAEKASKSKSLKNENKADCAPDMIVTYKAKKGDTIASIARQYGVKVSEIRKMNKIKNNKLKENQIIKIRKD